MMHFESGQDKTKAAGYMLRVDKTRPRLQAKAKTVDRILSSPHLLRIIHVACMKYRQLARAQDPPVNVPARHVAQPAVRLSRSTWGAEGP